MTDISTKKGTEAPPRLYDLTSLQVECNKKYNLSADQTLQTIQSLYEKKYTTYPRVDTTYLSDDIYPKCPDILAKLTNYADLTSPLAGKKLPKSKKVFDNSKVTDHHAIIPTGVVPQGLSFAEEKVYDEVCRHFIAVFYPDCQFATTTVLGKVEEVEFKTSGKQILVLGWREVIKPVKKEEVGGMKEEVEGEKEDEEKTLPIFTKGEHGPHQPQLAEKRTSPPKPYTEATLLRAMETAGKLVDDESLREVMKENGIGRPSTRAAIIETLFKRNYIKKIRKSLEPTPTGIELIGLIREDLLKSAELTGIWEKKLREIEQHKYEARQFLDELKQMVTEIVTTVMMDNSNRRVAATVMEEKPKKTAPKKAIKPKKEAVPENPDAIIGQPCPLCGKGHIIKGKTAYGCSEWRNGCGWRKVFE